MAITLDDVIALENLERKLRAILPEQYQYSYESVSPQPMGSAGLKYGADGRVAWDGMWASFCDLAMAGGPPHRGMLLEPGTIDSTDAGRDSFRQVADEIARGITAVTGLPVMPASETTPEWISVQCGSAGMAGWLVRAIVMENVMARHERETLLLPAGPNYRVGKEIRNVITATAKTCHYWKDHMSSEQHAFIEAIVAAGDLLAPASRKEVEDAAEPYRNILDTMAQYISDRLGRTCFLHRYTGWIGVEYPDERTAIWLMRAMVVEDILARRESGTLFLPVHHRFSGDGGLLRLLETLERCTRLCEIKGS